MRVLIIEDEAPASQRLIRLLNGIDRSIEIAGVIESVESSINWFIHNIHPDLVFMDIQLEDGLCFEIFEKIEIKTPVIFITAFDEFALKAFKVNSVDYLLKPVRREDLINAIKKYQQVHIKEEASSRLEDLINKLAPKTKERLLIKIGEHYKSIQISDIICFYIKERCCFIYIGKGKSYTLDYSLDKAESFIDPKRFFRINRNHIINFSAIRDIISFSSSRLKIVISDWPDNDELIVSRERAADFKTWMDR
ncbi:MAG TPA: LytTR family DNA-binding domain-containing protein [Ignavibacteriaceae bacterium]|nr:LytTR family DNA-binding domain-containing protein [Ignavibacteriaceae bacterium]